MTLRARIGQESAISLCMRILEIAAAPCVLASSNTVLDLWRIVSALLEVAEGARG